MAEADLYQWVNLTKKALFADNTDYKNDTVVIDNEERLGDLHFVCEFKDAKPELFKARIVSADKKNAKYNKNEKKRNRAFRMEKDDCIKAPPHLTSDKTKTKFTIPVQLPPAGGNKYKIEAKYDGKIIESKKIIETRRRLYYQIISMKQVSCPKSFDNFEKEFLKADCKHMIEMISKDESKKSLKFTKTIQRKNKAAFITHAKGKYTISKYSPYAIAIIFVNNIAYITENINKDKKNIKIPSFKTASKDLPNNLTSEVTVTLTNEVGKPVYLWNGLDDDDDAAKKGKYWLKAARIVKSDGTEINIPPDAITIDKSAKLNTGGYHKVKVILDHKVLANWADKILWEGYNVKGSVNDLEGVLELETYVVEKFLGGFSSGGSNEVLIATRSWWSAIKKTSQSLIQTVNHEVGHKIGMVATGNVKKPAVKPNQVTFLDSNTPDSHDDLYGQYHKNCGKKNNSKGHQGPHCENGVNYTKSKNTWYGTPKCVMFGSTRMKDSKSGVYKNTPQYFCKKCSKSIRKLDLNGHNIAALRNEFK
ncbi:hypothetical protein MNBD_GAMMA08-2635 [hydrothermal vent metagenome]|uniref:Uncharacterized protein n=1 Tax=hydrothermal vent metagenome TaxID=652676 RepID=A0A3B0X5F4_9ZZZZ